MLFHSLSGPEVHGVIDEMDRRAKSEAPAISSAIDRGDTETTMPSISSDRAALCAGCGGKISDRYYLLAVDKQWHMRCLKCCECKLNLESELTCFSKDGSIYCKEDYYRRFSVQRCARCHLGISASEMVMRARDLVYHLNCFTCTTCNKMLTTGDHFGMKDSLVYCRLHFEALLQGEYPAHFNHADVAAAAAAAAAAVRRQVWNCAKRGLKMQRFIFREKRRSVRRPWLRCLLIRGSRDEAGKRRQLPGLAGTSRASLGLTAALPSPPALAGEQWPQCGPWGSWDWKGDLGGCKRAGVPAGVCAHVSGCGDASLFVEVSHILGPSHPDPLQSPSLWGTVLPKRALSCNENDAEHLDRDQPYPSSQKTKRMRTSFKHHQLRTMKSYFAINHNPDAKDLKQLAQKTGLTKRVLQVWFQNARAKFRRNLLRQENTGVDKSTDAALQTGTPSGPASELSNASLSPSSTPTTLTDLTSPTLPTVTSVLTSVPGNLEGHEPHSPSQTTLTNLF
ncbi:LIM/homeobox protein Lhx2 [Carlito syrichta]|uniref:LIM/homeobox protein Lhx2 n=1 Tax=Carlito syrichta TaxID=1868482 RepID=A0A3Q0DVM6_CARSF|nr:LIM/homeobox protein Lhx2 [Carlito syrichta]